MRVITITTMSKDTVTKKIKIWGIVQGVGFRPFTARLADRFHMKGQIRNMGGLVEIYLTDTEERISAFLAALAEEYEALRARAEKAEEFDSARRLFKTTTTATGHRRMHAFYPAPQFGQKWSVL